MKLAEYRVWMAEQRELELLVADHAADPMDTVASAHESVTTALGEMHSALSELDTSSLDGDALMGTVLAVGRPRVGHSMQRTPSCWDASMRLVSRRSKPGCGPNSGKRTARTLNQQRWPAS